MQRLSGRETKSLLPEILQKSYASILLQPSRRKEGSEKHECSW